jgi:hypothetical protein
MNFTIEIIATGDDGSDELLHKTTVEAMTARDARKEASRLLKGWSSKHKATRVRMMNERAELLYSWTG